MAHNPAFDLHTAHTLLLGALMGRFVHSLASPLSLASMRLLCATLPSEQPALESAQDTITAALGDLQRCQQIMQSFNQQLLYNDEVELVQLNECVDNLATAVTSLALFSFDVVTVAPAQHLLPMLLPTGYLKLLLLSVLAALARIENDALRTFSQRTRIELAFPDQQTLRLHCSDSARLATFVERYQIALACSSFTHGLFWNIVHLGTILNCGITPSTNDELAVLVFHFAPC